MIKGEHCKLTKARVNHIGSAGVIVSVILSLVAAVIDILYP